MKDIYLINYSVKGIKTLDQLVSLSFYRKTIPKQPETQKYNIKGIYGINGSGKSGIVTSVGILKNLLINPGYLSNPVVQKSLDSIVNKKTGELFIEVEFIALSDKEPVLFHYQIALVKNITRKYIINYEQLSSRRASSKDPFMKIIFEIANGEIVEISEKENDKFPIILRQKTANLLAVSTICALYCEKILAQMPEIYTKYRNSFLTFGLCSLFVFGNKLHVYLDQSDDHTNYLIYNLLGYSDDSGKTDLGMDFLIKSVFEMDTDQLNVISADTNIVPKESYESFVKTIEHMRDFLHIFKSDLQSIEIDRKEDHDAYICSLIIVYDSYKINAEFESTGIKKLIKLYAYLKEMVRGDIVFIDEFDSNLHDVYLCALLEYLMEYGEGQLCFTTHNVGPMDILKQRKKSIDFLSSDHKIYSWTTNGNYSPARLYRNGMIEGSPFNVDSIDFIGVFDSGEGAK